MSGRDFEAGEKVIIRGGRGHIEKVLAVKHETFVSGGYQQVLKITAMDREGRFIWMRAAHLERATSSVSVLEGTEEK